MHAGNARLAMRVAVVMSTFNGARFVARQVASILEQLPADGLLMVRDDGSTDATRDIVAALDDPRVRLVRGANVGFARSFFELLRSVPDDLELVLLADQDDVWLPGKIQRARDALAPHRGRAALYFSRLRLVDTELQTLGESPAWPRGPSFGNALAENIVTGCTVALTPQARELVCRTGDEGLIYFHDWWMYLVVSAFGTVVMDAEPTILYRQHGGNVIGFGQGLVPRYLAIVRFIRRHSWVHILFRQAANFRAVHGDALAPAQRAQLDRYFDARRAGSIARLLFLPVRHRQFLRDEFLLRGLVLWELAFGRGLLPR